MMEHFPPATGKMNLSDHKLRWVAADRIRLDLSTIDMRQFDTAVPKDWTRKGSSVYVRN